MRLFCAAILRLAIASLPIVVLCLAGCRDWSAPAMAQESDDSQRPPLEIRFLPAAGLRAKDGEISCQVPAGRDHVYDAQTGEFHVQFQVRNFTRGGFEVTKVAERIHRHIVFRLTGIPAVYGCLGQPLVLTVGEKSYALDPSSESQYWRDEAPFDPALFRSTRKEDELMLELTDEGKSVLKPGARVTLEIDTGW